MPKKTADLLINKKAKTVQLPAKAKTQYDGVKHQTIAKLLDLPTNINIEEGKLNKAVDIAAIMIQAIVKIPEEIKDVKSSFKSTKTDDTHKSNVKNSESTLQQDSKAQNLINKTLYQFVLTEMDINELKAYMSLFGSKFLSMLENKLRDLNEKTYKAFAEAASEFIREEHDKEKRQTQKDSIEDQEDDELFLDFAQIIGIATIISSIQHVEPHDIFAHMKDLADKRGIHAEIYCVFKDCLHDIQQNQNGNKSHNESDGNKLPAAHNFNKDEQNFILLKNAIMPKLQIALQNIQQRDNIKCILKEFNSHMDQKTLERQEKQMHSRKINKQKIKLSEPKTAAIQRAK